MYTKTRNTLTALIAASLFIAAGWLLGHPIDSSVDLQDSTMAHVSIAGATAQVAVDTSVSRLRHANRMSLAMPYYSFSLLSSQRRAD